MSKKTMEQWNKKIINSETEVAFVNGEKIPAEALQKWAYRRLEVFPELVEMCRDFVFLEKTNMTKKQVRLQIDRAKAVIEKAAN